MDVELKRVRIAMGPDPYVQQQLKCQEPVELHVETVHLGSVTRQVPEGHWELSEDYDQLTGEWNLLVHRHGEPRRAAYSNYPDYEEAEEDRMIMHIVLSRDEAKSFLMVETWPVLIKSVLFGDIRMTLTPGQWRIQPVFDEAGKYSELKISRTQ